MTAHALGKPSAARDYYDRAVARLEATYPDNPQTVLFRDEAASVLGVSPGS